MQHPNRQINRQTTLSSLLAGILLLANSCSTTKEDANESNIQESLDISSDEKPSNTADLLESNGVLANRVSAKVAFKWQQYFKASPSAQDREILKSGASKLKTASDTDSLLKRARSETALAQYVIAEASYRELLRKTPNHVEAMIELTGVYHKLRDPESMLQILGDVKQQFSAQEKPSPLLIFRYRYMVALAEIQRGKRPVAHSILSDLIGQDRTFTPGYVALAASYLSIGKESAAKFILERALDRGPEDAAIYNLLGVIQERSGKLASAKENYDKSIKLNDNFAPALVNRANIYVKMSDLTLAEGDVKKALNIDPMNIDAMMSLAVIQSKTGRVTQAKSHLMRVLEITPESAEARYNLAILAKEHENNTSEASRLFKEVAQTNQASPDLKNLARAALDELKQL